MSSHTCKASIVISNITHNIPYIVSIRTLQHEKINYTTKVVEVVVEQVQFVWQRLFTFYQLYGSLDNFFLGTMRRAAVANKTQSSRALKVVKELDAFPKVPDNFKQTSASRGGGKFYKCRHVSNFLLQYCSKIICCLQ